MYTYYTKRKVINRNKQEVINSLDTLLFKDEITYIPVFPFCYFDSKYYSLLKKRRLSPFYGDRRSNIFELRTHPRLNQTWSIRFDIEIIEEYDKSIMQIEFKLSKFDIITSTIGVAVFFGFLVFGGFEFYLLPIFVVAISIQIFFRINTILRKIKRSVNTK